MRNKLENPSKITKAEVIGDIAQVIDHLPSKHEALSSNTVPPKKKY
jgi:hypothetical protein